MGSALSSCRSETIGHLYVALVVSLHYAEGARAVKQVRVFEATNPDGVLSRGGVIGDLPVVITRWGKLAGVRREIQNGKR